MWRPKLFRLGERVVVVLEEDPRPIPGTITFEPKTSGGRYVVTPTDGGKKIRCYDYDLANPDDAEKIEWLASGGREKRRKEIEARMAASAGE